MKLPETLGGCREFRRIARKDKLRAERRIKAANTKIIELKKSLKCSAIIK